MTVLGTLVARIAVILRGIALAELVVQVILWRSFYLASPLLLWGPAVALAWGGTAIAFLRRRRPGWRFVCVDTAVYAGLAVGAAWCVPAAMRGVAGSWLFILVTSQAVVPVWFASRALLVALAPAIAFAMGDVLAPSAAVAPGPRRASLVLLFGVVLVHLLVRWMLCRRAARADAVLAAAYQEERDQYVVLSENIERREQDRLMHDTILNTLTAIAGSGAAAAVAGQCRRDIGLLQSALSDSDTTHPRGRPDSGPLAAVEAVVGEMRARGLAVDLEVSGGTGAEGSPEAGVVPGPVVAALAHAAREALAGVAEHAGTGAEGSPEAGVVPGPVVAALAHATREALANVAEHAGTGRAWVTVGMTPPDEDGGPPRIEVTVRDEGAGFDPGRVGPARLGVRRSITERVEDRGGSATVSSAPGGGTVVRLCWPAARPGAGPAALQVIGAGIEEVPGPW
jgi:signal transduction histidine kinase